MISIITCSVDTSRLNRLRSNIEETIGVPYELIPIDNSSNRYGICAAYNLGGSQAKYPYLCFMHEDILFETGNWGRLLIRHLQDPGLGLIGVAGGDARALVPSSWSVPIGSKQVHLFQHYKYKEGTPQHILETDAAGYADKKRVVALDGVWLATRKDVFLRYQFDADTFPGFHGYDIDYSLQVNTAYRVYVIFDILLHHYSEGKPDRTWIKSAIRLSSKWKSRLPVSVEQETREVYHLHHWQSMRAFLERLSELDYNYFQRLYFLVYYSCNRYFSLRRLGSMGKFTLLGSSDKKISS
jgi:glycosyltransferase involved in cell wall biosynthesis